MIPQLPSTSGRSLVNEKLHYGSILHLQVGLELSQDSSDSAACSSLFLPTSGYRIGGHGNMFAMEDRRNGLYPSVNENTLPAAASQTLA